MGAAHHTLTPKILLEFSRLSDLPGSSFAQFEVAWLLAVAKKAMESSGSRQRFRG